MNTNSSLDITAFIISLCLPTFVLSSYKMHSYMKKEGKDLAWAGILLTLLISEYYSHTLKNEGKCGIWLKILILCVMLPVISLIASYLIPLSLKS